MNRSNILAAGKMMSIVLMLFGIVNCAAAFTPYMRQYLGMPETAASGMLLFLMLVNSLSLILSGLLLVILLAGASDYKPLGTPILALGTFVLIYGMLSAVFVAGSPLSWMTAILGLAIFITTVCLKIDLREDKR